jgi:hypothetical protein
MIDSNLQSAVQPDIVKQAHEAILTEDARAREQYVQFMRAFDGHKQWVKKAIKYDAMYRGDQWDQADADKLNAEGRPNLTINLILSTLNVMLGEQITGRMDLQYKPRTDGLEESTFALTKLAMSILDANQYKWVESTVYADALIQDRGYFDIRVDWTDPGKPCVKIRDLNPLNVIPDPDAQHWDPRKWREVWYTDWVSLDQIAVEYGEEMAAKLRSLAENGTTYGTDSIIIDRQTFGDNSVAFDNVRQPQEKARVRHIRVIERQYFVSTRVHYLVHPETGERRQLPLDTKASEAKKLAESLKTLLHSVTEQRVKWLVTADRFVLLDSFSPYRSFTILPMFPYFRRGKPFGVVSNLVSPQEQLNKLESQELHIINTTANSGWMVEQGALHGMTEDELAQNGSKTGVVIKLNHGGLGKIEKIQPNNVPSGIDRASAKSAGHLKQISGVNDSMLGTEAPEVSGVAMEKKTSVGQVQLAVVADALNRTRHMVGRQLLDIIKDFFGFEQIITYSTGTTPDQQEATQSLTINQIQPDGSVLFDTTVGDYDVVISTQPDRDSFNEIQFAEALSLRNAGVMVPDHHIILTSNLANKTQIAEEVKQQSGLGDVPPEQLALQQRAQEAEVRGLESKAEKDAALAEQARATAVLNETKAAVTAQEPEHKQRALEQDFAKESRGHQVRKDLALIAAANKLDQTILQKQLNPTKKEAT